MIDKPRSDGRAADALRPVTITRSWLDPLAAPPAPGQGALVIETRAEDVDLPWLQAVRCPATTLAVAAERGALYALEGSCRTAVGAHARLSAQLTSGPRSRMTPSSFQSTRFFDFQT